MSGKMPNFDIEEIREKLAENEATAWLAEMSADEARLLAGGLLIVFGVVSFFLYAGTGRQETSPAYARSYGVSDHRSSGELRPVRATYDNAPDARGGGGGGGAGGGGGSGMGGGSFGSLQTFDADADEPCEADDISFSESLVRYGGMRMFSPRRMPAHCASGRSTARR